MRKSVIAILLVFSLIATGAYAGGMMEKAEFTALEACKLIGNQVENRQGDVLGKISDFVIDSRGRVAFVVLSHEHFAEWAPVSPKMVAIPFSALTFNPEEKIFIADVGLDRVITAPEFDRTALGDRSWTEDTYRYFGLQPYWTEEELSPTINLPLIYE